MTETREGARAGSATGRANPVLVEVTRGDMVESRHRGAACVVDAEGKVQLAVGDVEATVYPRSAVKPIQALPLLESGAAEAFGLTDAEIALACASHAGERRHVGVAAAWLEKIGCTPADLECGAHPPLSESAARALAREGEKPGALHNNCSGKHTGFLTVARHLGVPTLGYIGPDHPVQERVLKVLEEMTGLDLARAPRGIDGCGIPVIGLPLSRLALGMARLADPAGQPEARQHAIARIRRAVAAEPELIDGRGRFASEIMATTAPRALLKGGAEGVYCAVLPEAGLGAALKVDDGAARGAQAAMGRLLRRLGVLADPEAERLRAWLEPAVRNWAGREVGRVRPAEAAPL